ncbi:MAG: arginase [Capsulimonadaceae bacterium]
MHDIIGAPFDNASYERGCRDSPDALRRFGLSNRLTWLRKMGVEAVDGGDVVPDNEDEDAVSYCDRLFKGVGTVYDQGRRPIIVGGDHAISMGTVAAAAEHLRKIDGCDARLGLVWVDAHADLETPESSSSGNLHGTPMAHLLGLGDQSLAAVGGFTPKVRPEHVAYIGLRDTSPAERSLIRTMELTTYTIPDIERLGITGVCERVMQAMDALDGFVVSFDMDAIDPTDAPGVQAPAPGGLHYREAKVVMELAALAPKLLSIEIVEFNPTRDRDDITVRAVVGLLESAMGLRVV